jgi:hypothetical protein
MDLVDSEAGFRSYVIPGSKKGLQQEEYSRSEPVERTRSERLYLV